MVRFFAIRSVKSIKTASLGGVSVCMLFMLFKFFFVGVIVVAVHCSRYWNVFVSFEFLWQ